MTGNRPTSKYFPLEARSIVGVKHTGSYPRVHTNRAYVPPVGQA